MSGPPAWAGDGLHGRLGLADDRHCLALLDGIGHPVDGAHNSRTGPELGVQILDLQERCQDPSRCSPSSYSFYQFSASVSAAERAVNDGDLRGRARRLEVAHDW